MIEPVYMYMDVEQPVTVLGVVEEVSLCILLADITHIAG